jgi:hypothetical protein
MKSQRIAKAFRSLLFFETDLAELRTRSGVNLAKA